MKFIIRHTYIAASVRSVTSFIIRNCHTSQREFYRRKNEPTFSEQILYYRVLYNQNILYITPGAGHRWHWEAIDSSEWP